MRLTEVFRQAAESQIIVNAHRINQGLMPDLATLEGGDFYFVDAADADEAVRKLLAIVQERIPQRFGFHPVRDIQVLCPMNRGGLGARSLNIELQKVLNAPGEIRIERFGWIFSPGDKVMKVENDYDKEVYNGDLGVVSHIDAEGGELHVDFEGREPSTRARARNPCRRDPAQHPALPDAAAEPGLYGGDTGQAAGGAGRAAKGVGDRGQGNAGTATVVEATGVADLQSHRARS